MTGLTLEALPYMKTSRTVRRAVRGLIVLLAIGATLALSLTFFRFSGGGGEPLNPLSLTLLVIGNLLVLLALSSFVLTRVYRLWQAARAGLIGTRLQTRIIATFAIVAVVPTLIVTLFAALFFNVGIKTWFDERVSVALDESVTLAEAYLDEHRSTLRRDVQMMAGELAQELPLLSISPTRFSKTLDMLASSRSLSEAIVFTPQRVVSRTALSFSLTFERLPDEMLKRADEGNIVFLATDEEDKLRAVIKLPHSDDLYLLVGRSVDQTVIDHMKVARATSTQYRELQRDIRALQIQFVLAFVLLALLLVFAAIWAGMTVALRVVGPVSLLIAAAERISAGDYAIRVPEGKLDDEIATLARTFNRMSGQLDKQRTALIEANRLLDERRRLTEAVFAGVSAGVIALDAQQRITLHNRSALSLLGEVETDALQGTTILQHLPETAELLAEAEARPERVAARDIVRSRASNGSEVRQTLHVRIALEKNGERIEGYVVTFDDITDLVNAQRSAAWADVARRVAHEIKNPLTPITLSTERLRKKFADEITSDRESYLKYLDTITRHVRDIGKMVEEFVAFARMPTAQFKDESLTQIVRKSVFSEQTAHPEIRYELTAPADDVTLYCDERQIGQMLLNLLKNAGEAITEQPAAEAKEIRVTLRTAPEQVILEIHDSGPGFPPDAIPKLTEPYVTTRVKGTGLGLAIAKRTVEEHKGTLTLANHPQGGALVTLIFPRAG
jgi:two-component system nitrogen regulation sensor histidine kinase NtrY